MRFTVERDRGILGWVVRCGTRRVAVFFNRQNARNYRDWMNSQ